MSISSNMLRPLQILILESNGAASAYQGQLEQVSLSAELNIVSSPESARGALSRRSYDALVWKISSETQDLAALKAFLNSAEASPSVFVVARHEARGSETQDSLLQLLNHGVQDFFFDDEPALLGRIARRVANRQAENGEGPLNTREALAAFVDACPLAVIALSLDGNVLLWNPAAEAIFGWRSEEVVGMPLPTVPEEAEHEFRGLLEAQLQGISQHGKEVERRRKDGVLVHLSLWTAPLRDKNGSIQGKVALLADMSQQRRDEQERLGLVKSERDARVQAETMDRFRELLEAAPDAIIETNADGNIVLLNAATEQLFGYTRAELLGRTVDCLIPDDARSRHAAHRAHYMGNPTTRPMGSGLQLNGRRKDGTHFPVEISLSPVKSATGFRISAIIRDVSERKKVEEQLRAVNEKFTAELTLANRELELRNREIEQANRLKSEFLASMSHELRTPLHTIIGFSELLGEELEGPLNTKQKRFIDHVHKDSLHLLELINEILDISKIEAGKLTLHAEAFNVFDAVAEVLGSIAPVAAAKSISLEHPSGRNFDDQCR